jgi:predicted phage tail protein
MKQKQPFRVLAKHDGAETDGYRLYINDTQIAELPVSALANGVIEFTHDGLPKGQYVLHVSAFNADGESFSTPHILQVTGTAPAAPVSVEITAI